jgi:hypothetical protein
MKNSIIAAALLTAAFSTSALAQTAPSSTAPAASPPAVTAPAPSDKLMLKDSWRASKLIGLDVYNDANEKLGDINELIVGKDGKISAVVIGVGGFLGMGEHDVAVTMDKLKFMETAVRTSTNTPAKTTTTGSQPTTTGAATTTTTTTSTTTASNTNDWTPDHAVMSATKDQLKAMPQFKYSDYN